MQVQLNVIEKQSLSSNSSNIRRKIKVLQRKASEKISQTKISREGVFLKDESFIATMDESLMKELNKVSINSGQKIGVLAHIAVINSTIINNATNKDNATITSSAATGSFISRKIQIDSIKEKEDATLFLMLQNLQRRKISSPRNNSSSLENREKISCKGT